MTVLPPDPIPDPMPDLMPELLWRSRRPGAVDVAQVRRLASRYRDAFAPSPLLQRLLARRGEQDTTIVSGTLLLALPPLPPPADEDHAPPSQPLVIASASRIESASAGEGALPLAVARSPAVSAADAGARPAANTAPDRQSIRVEPAQAPFAMPAPGHTTTVSAAPALVQHPQPRAVAQALAAVDIAAGTVLKRAPGRAAAVIEWPVGGDDVPVPLAGSLAASSPLPLAASHETPQPRELPGPAIAADLLLPPNPLPETTQRLRRTRAAVVEVDGQPIESSSLPLMVTAAAAPASSPVPPTAANAALYTSAVSPARPAAMSAPPRSPAAIESQAAGLPPAAVPADPQQLADQVARELTRSLRRARERKGMPPWTS